MKINSMEVGIWLLVFGGCSTRPDAVYNTDDRIRLALKKRQSAVA